MSQPGNLYVVATPIGNLGDITLRARDVLTGVPVIACEDTRRTSKLLGLLEITRADKQLLSLHTHNEDRVSQQIINLLEDSIDVALVSDAGTPLVSDPGYLLVRQAHAEGIPVVPVPGVSALTAALSVCPIPLNEFRFIGFLSRNKGERKRVLQEIVSSVIPTIFYESPQRVVATLAESVEIGLHERRIFMGREISKQFEEFLHDSVANVYKTLSARQQIQGEIVVIVDGGGSRSSSIEVEHLLDLFKGEEIKPTVAARLIAKLSGESRNEIYARMKDLD